MAEIESTVAPEPVKLARYSTVAIALHWTIAALMLFQLALGHFMGPGRTPLSFARFQLHKSVGITILLLTVLRLLWRLVKKPPAPSVGGWEGALAKLVHVAFYGLLLALPITGWIIVSASPTQIPTLLYGLVHWPHLPGVAPSEALSHSMEEVHEWLAWLAILAIALHVAGALKHQILDRDLTFARMAPGAGRGFDGRLWLAGLVALGAIVFGVLIRPPVPALHAAAPPPAAAEPTPLASEPAPTPTPPVPAASATPTPTPTESAAPTGALASWKVQSGKRLGFATTWSGEAVTGSFTSWSADIAFGADALDKSHVTVTIQTGSARTGQEQPDSTLPTDDWFATAMFPTASFEARSFKKTGADRYVANGTLTIRGKSKPLSLPFTLKIDGDTAKMTGSATIDRTAFGVGFAGTDEIPADVKLNVSLTAKRK